MNLLIADDHSLFKEALCYYLARQRPDINVVSVNDLYDAGSYLNDVQDIQDRKIDILLLDFLMLGMSGFLGIRKMRSLFPNVPILLMSGVASKDDVREAMNAGCSGFFPKTLSCDDLLRGLSTILDEEKFIPIDLDTGQILGSFKSYTQRHEGDGDIHARWMKFRENSLQEKHVKLNKLYDPEVINMTKRETDVLEHLVHGRKNKDIADAIGVKIVTVKLHVRSICKKLSVENRTQAALRARDLNILEVSPL
jgi:DNA-binding NarL/FixJ family response regulator